MAKIFLSICCALLLSSGSAFAASTSVDGSIGFGDHDSMAYGLQVRQTYEPFISGELGSLAPFAELGVSLWTGHGDSVWGASLAPGLIFTLGTSTFFEPYIAGSVGGAVITDDKFDHIDLGSHALFKTKGAVGVRFGEGLHHRIQGEYTNYSNWGISDVDQGYSTYSLMYGYSF